MKIFEYYDIGLLAYERGDVKWDIVKKLKIDDHGYVEVVEPTYEDMNTVIFEHDNITLYSNGIHVSFYKKSGFTRNDLLTCILESETDSYALTKYIHNIVGYKYISFGYLEERGEGNVFEVLWDVL